MCKEKKMTRKFSVLGVILITVVFGLTFSACASAPSVPSITDRNLLGVWVNDNLGVEFHFFEDYFLFADVKDLLFYRGPWGNDGNNKVIAKINSIIVGTSGVAVGSDIKSWTFSYAFLSSNSIAIKDTFYGGSPLSRLNDTYTRK